MEEKEKAAKKKKKKPAGSGANTPLTASSPLRLAAGSTGAGKVGEGEEVSEVHLARGALSVSGGALRAHRDGTVLRGHVLDPRSGVPVEAARLAWVQHESAAASDALATALLVAGPSLPAVPGATGGFVASAEEPLSNWPLSP